MTDYDDSDIRIPLMTLAEQDLQRTRNMALSGLALALLLWALFLGAAIYLMTRPEPDTAKPTPAVTDPIAQRSYIGVIQVLDVLPVECPEGRNCI